MEWEKIYKKRTVSMQKAVSHIKSGNRLVLGQAMAVPLALLDGMIEEKARLKNVEVVQMVPMGNAKFAEPEMEPHFRLNSIFAGAYTKEAIKAGRADYTPCHFSEVPGLFDELLPIDVALVQATPPDKHGYVSLGVSVDYTLAAVKKARLVIAQINHQMPRTHGDSFIHVSEIDWFVEKDMPMIELPPPKIGEVEKAIGEHCASLIHDGDTLQLGIGAIPDAVLLFLKDKKDLGIHSEMISDGVVELIDAGVITNRRKNIHRGKSIVTFLMGTRRLYDYVDDNPSIAMYPVDYVNDPYVIGQNDNLVSINSCVQVDFMGQVCSESIGTTQISGTGGQVDFVRGAKLSQGGRSIIAISATAGGGKVSKIVPFITEGSAVTTLRTDVDYIITEFGIAKLRGKSLRERAKSLIAIAHPDFQDQLKAAYEQRFCCKYDE